MTVPNPALHESTTDVSSSRLLRSATWVAIGALIAAAVVSVVWVLVGSQNGIVGRAFLTILLLTAFAGVAILDAHLAARRPSWFTLASMIGWVVSLLVGAFYIWAPEGDLSQSGGGAVRFFEFALVALILQLALLHVRLFVKAFLRNVTRFTSIVAYATIVLVSILVIQLVLALMLNEWIVFKELYWRFVVAVSILAAVGTALIPLTNLLFAPKRRQPPMAGATQPWPTYADAVTPLPVMPDGSPDWNAYYTGYPSTVPQAIAPMQGYPTPDPAAQEWADPQQQWAVSADAPHEAAVELQQGTVPQEASWAPANPEQAWPAPEQAPQAWPVPEQSPQAWPAPEQPPQAWPASQQPAGWPPPEQQPAAWPPPESPQSPAGYQGYPPPPPVPGR